MATLQRVVVQWAGNGVVGSAVNVLHYSGSEGGVPDVAAIRAAYANLIPSLGSGTQILVPGSGDVIEDTTGELVGSWTATTPATVVGTGGGSIAAGVGACIGWATGGIVNGRRLRGRTFLVPMAAGGYDTDGTLGGGSLLVAQQCAGGLMAAGPLGVWHRPTTVGGSDGTSYGVTSYKVRDKVAFLSSRRD